MVGSPASRTVHALVAGGVTHVLGLPDAVSSPLFGVLVRHPVIRLVTVSRDGEAFAIAAGLWIGGAAPLVVVRSTGLLESGDALRGTVMLMAAPVPILVTGRGHASSTPEESGRGDEPEFGALARPGLDSGAALTEATLEAWGVPFQRCREDDDSVAALLETIDTVRRSQRPTALLLSHALP